MSEDDVLFGYRLRVLAYAERSSVSEVLAYAERSSVSEGCRVFGIHRSTFYV